jgi:hypothetical protein
MTAEVVVMNPEGVALAADSLVTISEEKKFDTASKLHMLAPKFPIALMIFNSANFMQLPWAVIIKGYREYLGKKPRSFLTLEDMAKHFIAYVKRSEGVFSSEVQQQHYVHNVIDSALDRCVHAIVSRFKQEVYKSGDRIPRSQITEIINEAVNKYWNTFRGYPNAYPRKSLSDFKGSFRRRYSKVITERIKFHFDRTPLTETQKRKLKEFCFFLFTKRWNTTSYSGLVFAGYGEKDLLPKCKSYRVESLLCGHLNIENFKEAKIDFAGSAAVIIPFAQEDVVAALLNARHPQYYDLLSKELKAELSEEKADKLLNRMEDQIEKDYTHSIMRTVVALPKEDLAIVAETIVNLTSFLRKVSMKLETVGGPIDVAVISKKDGFIWIKRKHYFDLKFNKHFEVTN